MALCRGITTATAWWLVGRAGRQGQIRGPRAGWERLQACGYLPFFLTNRCQKLGSLRLQSAVCLCTSGPAAGGTSSVFRLPSAQTSQTQRGDQTHTFQRAQSSNLRLTAHMVSCPPHIPQQALQSRARVSTCEGQEVTRAQTSLLSHHPQHPPRTCRDHRKEPGHRFPVPLPMSAPGGPGGLAARGGPRPEHGEAQIGPVARWLLPAILSHLALGGAP